VPPDDFFDGEWEEPSRTQETAPTRPEGEQPAAPERPPRAGRDRGRPPRGRGSRPTMPAMPSLEGLEWGRLGLLAAGIVVVVLVLLLGARACSGSSATSKNRAYFDQVKAVLATSDRAGASLHDMFHSAKPIRSKAAIKQLQRIRAQAQAAVDAATKLKPTTQVETLQPALLQTLSYRVNGLDCLIRGLPQAYKERRTTAAGGQLVICTDRLLASDIIYMDSFEGPAGTALQKAGVADVAVPTSSFLGNDDQVTLTAAGMGSVLQRWKPGSVAHGLHGLKLDTVVARGADGKTVTLQTSTLTPVKATGLSFLVTATNGGNFEEFNVPVKITIGSGSTAIVKTGVIPSIAKGTSETVTISGFNTTSNLQFGTPVTMKVEVVPVPGERTASNNSQTFQITFSL
jgi:hypothetical protein